MPKDEFGLPNFQQKNFLCPSRRYKTQYLNICLLHFWYMIHTYIRQKYFYHSELVTLSCQSFVTVSFSNLLKLTIVLSTLRSKRLFILYSTLQLHIASFS